MKSKTVLLVMFAVFISLVSCTPKPLLISTSVTITQTSISKPVIENSTPIFVPKVDRWIQYQSALSVVYLSSSVSGLCEWNILGQSEHKIYVWAICQEANSIGGAAMSAPAVIHLAQNRDIEKVEVPGDGSQYGVEIRRMFPSTLQEKVLSYEANSKDSLDAMWNHIQLRHKNPDTPLIVKAGISLP